MIFGREADPQTRREVAEKDRLQAAELGGQHDRTNRTTGRTAQYPRITTSTMLAASAARWPPPKRWIRPSRSSLSPSRRCDTMASRAARRPPTRRRDTAAGEGSVSANKDPARRNRGINFAPESRDGLRRPRNSVQQCRAGAGSGAGRGFHRRDTRTSAASDRGISTMKGHHSAQRSAKILRADSRQDLRA